MRSVKRTFYQSKWKNIEMKRNGNSNFFSHGSFFITVPLPVSERANYKDLFAEVSHNVFSDRRNDCRNVLQNKQKFILDTTGSWGDNFVLISSFNC